MPCGDPSHPMGGKRRGGGGGWGATPGVEGDQVSKGGGAWGLLKEGLQGGVWAKEGVAIKHEL